MGAHPAPGTFCKQKTTGDRVDLRPASPEQRPELCSSGPGGEAHPGGLGICVRGLQAAY